MSYKITIPKHGERAGQIEIESLDSTSCGTVHEVSQQSGQILSVTSINHGDDNPVYDSVQVTE